MTPADFKAAFQNVPIAIHARQWVCVYLHSFGPTQPIYIGTCSPEQLLSPTEARQNTKWFEEIDIRYKDRVVILNVSVLHVTLTQEEADKLAAIEIAARQPYCNMLGTRKDGNKAAIETWVNEQIVQYPSIAAAAKALGIPAPSISNHLANRPGYKTVKGLQFRRVSS